jgi:hypothetical protein
MATNITGFETLRLFSVELLEGKLFKNPDTFPEQKIAEAISRETLIKFLSNFLLVCNVNFRNIT